MAWTERNDRMNSASRQLFFVFASLHSKHVVFGILHRTSDVFQGISRTYKKNNNNKSRPDNR